MDRQRSRRIEELRLAASELQGEDRDRYLAESCATPEERHEVEMSLQSGLRLTQRSASDRGKRPDAADCRPGDLFGRYRIQALLGEGGGGKVYKALDPDLRRSVAIKILPPGAGREEEDRHRFRREAETASALNHPNIVTVYEIGTEDGIDYLAMEYISGKTLRESIPKRGLKLAQFFPWAIQIADALAGAHQAGVIHRDLKPTNVMITDRGTAKVVDFGIAKVTRLGEDDATVTLSREGMVLGTFAYMAPEQAEAKAADARADIFSFGCVLYEMITGRPAFSGSLLTILGKVMQGEPPPIRELAPDIPKGLEQLIFLCLRKDPAERWQSAADIRLLLEQLQTNWQAGEAAVRVRRPANRWLAPAAAGAVLLAAGGSYYYGRRTIPAAPEYRTIALTSDTGLSTAPSISGDGRMLAYASDRGGGENLDIWVQHVGGRAPIRLTSDPADETDPDISPDGTRVAFRSEKDGGGIYVVPALGGEAVLLAQGGRSPRFSPDGASVAYWVGGEGVLMPAGSSQAYIISSGGGHPRPVGDLAAAMYPVWSPDGRAVLVVGRRTANYAVERRPDWWLVPLGKGEPRSLQLALQTRNPTLRMAKPHVQFVPVAWDAEAGVVFGAQAGDATNLWALPVNPEDGRPTGELRRLTSGTGSEQHAAFATTREGRLMAYTSLALRFNLWALPIDEETGVARGDLRRLTSDLSLAFYPSVSWDGSKVAFTRAGSSYSLGLLDLPSGKEATLLTSLTSYVMPRLSGDGRWITFREAPVTVSRIAARGGTVTRLCEKCGTPMYSSFDGSKVLIEPAEDPPDIRQIDAATGKITTLAPAREQLYSADMTRDGRWVAFHGVKSGSSNSQVFVARIDGEHTVPPAEWIPITGADAFYQGPRWSPKGGVLYFLSNRDGFRCIWAQRVNPATKVPVGPLFAVLHLHYSRRSLQHLATMDDRISVAVAPGMLVTVAGELSGNIWMRDYQLK